MVAQRSDEKGRQREREGGRVRERERERERENVERSAMGIDLLTV